MQHSKRKKAAIMAALAAALLSGAGIASAESWTVSGETIPNQKFYANALPHAPGANIEGNSLTITDGSFSGNFFGLLSYSSSGMPLGSYKNNVMTINSGNFDYVAIYNNNLTVQEVPAGQGSGNNIVINGGNFNCTYGSNSDSGFRTYQGDIVINGGTFGGEGWKMQTTGAVEIHDGDLSNLRTINANGVTIDGGTITGAGNNDIVFEFSEQGGTTQNLPPYSVNITGGTFNSGLLFVPAVSGTLNIENVEIPSLQFQGSNGGFFDTATLDGVTSKIKESGLYYRIDDFSISNSDLSGSDEVRAASISIDNSTTEGVIKIVDELTISDSTHTGNITAYDTATGDRQITLDNADVTGDISFEYWTVANGATSIDLKDGSTLTGNISDGNAEGLSVSLAGASKINGGVSIVGTGAESVKISSGEITGDVSTKGGFSLNAATLGGAFTGYAGNGADITGKAFAATDSSFAGAVSFVGDGGDFIVSGSSLDVSGSTFGGAVTGFHAARVDGCTIKATGSTFGGSLTAFKDDEYVTGSTLTLDGGSTIGGNVYLTDAATSTNNTLNLYTSAGLTAATIISSNANAYGTNTGNTLNIKNVLGATAGNLEKWQNINIYVPATAAKGDTVLTLAGGAATDLSGTAIKAGIEGDIEFAAGDEITLLKNAAGLTTDAATSYGTLTSGVSLIYDGLTVKKKDANNIILTIPAAPAPDPDPDPPTPPAPDPDPDPPAPPAPDPAPPTPDPAPPAPAPRPRVNPEIKSLLSGQLASMEIITEAVELGDAIRDAEIGENIFGVFSGAGIAADDVKSRNAHFVAGYKRADEEQIAAAFVQYGRGSYDSTLAGIDGSGNADYIGVGGYYEKAIGKDSFFDCGLNVGQVSRDYTGRGFSTVIDSTSHEKERSAYVGGFLRIGKTWSVLDDVADGLFAEEREKFGAYFMYSAAHVGGYDSRLSSGEAFQWSPITRHGLTVGGTWEKRLDKKGKVYGDLSITQTVGGTASATFKGGEVSEDTKGTFAALAVGWKQEIGAGQSVDLSVRGLAGHRSGAAVNVTYNLSF